MAEVAALFVDPAGPYAGRADIDAWDEARDARRYDGALPVVAHPPCERWGRFARGSPRNPVKVVGDDGGCFQASLAAVRRCGGVIEHPADSKAWPRFGLPLPPRKGWSPPDEYGGRSCYVDQGVYGHASKKPTWLYAVLPVFPELNWTRVWGRAWVGGDGYRNSKERARAKAAGKYQPAPEMPRDERHLTPPLFADCDVAGRETASSEPGLSDGLSPVDQRRQVKGCRWCRKEFTPAQASQEFCGKRCRQTAWRIRGKRSVSPSTSTTPEFLPGGGARRVC